MTNKQMKGLVVLMKNNKSLLQVKRIRIYQRENLVDKVSFLIPLEYEWINATDSGFDMTNFTVILNYLDGAGTVHTEILERYGHYDPVSERYIYEDYQKDENTDPTHMIYRLPVTTKITNLIGDVTMNLKLQYADYTAQTEDPATEPVPLLYQMATGDTTISILPVVDYYSIISSDTLSEIVQQIDILKARANTLEDRADAQEDDLSETKENMVNDVVLNEDRLILKNSKDEQVGNEIHMNDLGDSLAEYTQEGLVKVITDEEEDPNVVIIDDEDDSTDPTIIDPINPDADNSDITTGE